MPFWDLGKNSLKSIPGDVGELQIRSVLSSRPHELRLHERDRDDQIFVLVVRSEPKYELAGWLYAKEGKQAKYWRHWRNGTYAYFVPLKDLKPIESFPVKK